MKILLYWTIACIFSITFIQTFDIHGIEVFIIGLLFGIAGVTTGHIWDGDYDNRQQDAYRKHARGNHDDAY